MGLGMRADRLGEDAVFAGAVRWESAGGPGRLVDVEPVYGVYSTPDGGLSWGAGLLSGAAHFATAFRVAAELRGDRDMPEGWVVVVCVRRVRQWQGPTLAYGSVVDCGAVYHGIVHGNHPDVCPHGLFNLWAAVGQDLEVDLNAPAVLRIVAKEEANIIAGKLGAPANTGDRDDG